MSSGKADIQLEFWAWMAMVPSNNNMERPRFIPGKDIGFSIISLFSQS